VPSLHTGAVGRAAVYRSCALNQPSIRAGWRIVRDGRPSSRSGCGTALAAPFVVGRRCRFPANGKIRGNEHGTKGRVLGNVEEATAEDRSASIERTRRGNGASA
jgi:hypothetical protein